MEDSKDFADDEDSHNSIASITSSLVSNAMSSKKENVLVYLRLKPLSSNSCSSELYEFDKIENKVIVQHGINNAEKHYSFTSIFENMNQVKIYDRCVRPVLSSPFDIPGATFASYGCSNSGKTFTILGEEFSPGLIPRAITQIFNEYSQDISPFPCIKIINDRSFKCEALNDEMVCAEMENVEEFLKESKKYTKVKDFKWNHENIANEHNFQVTDKKFNRIYVWFSLVEIYNEKITDLLSLPKSNTHQRPLKIISNSGNSFIQGANWLHVADIKQAFEILKYGLSKISYATTGVNSNSSRSHTIFTINIIAEHLHNSEFQLTSFKFCDLAGAERLKKTGNAGERLKEAGVINNSLMVLGRCLESVISNQSKGNNKLGENVIPVRDSKLTFLIQSSLLGQEKFVMIVNLLPNADFFEENLNVLKFGSIASQIVMKKAKVRKFPRPSTSFSYFDSGTATSKMNSTSTTINM